MKNTPLSPQTVLDVLRNTPHPVRLDDILRFLAIHRGNKKVVLDILQNLAQSGQILRLRGGRWSYAGEVRTLTGVLSIQRTGSGFVTPHHDPARKSTADIFIPAWQLGDAWHGDTVEVALVPGSGKNRHLSPEGRILAVISRGVSELAVRVTRRRTLRGVLCRPADDRFPFELDVDVSALPPRPEKDGELLSKKEDELRFSVKEGELRLSIKEGELLLVVPGERLGPTLWAASARATLGLEDAVDVQERLVRLNHGIPETFSPNVLAESEATAAFHPGAGLVTGESALTTSGGERRDVRHIPFVTIDGADARDFDDAVCVEKLPHGGRVLWVAIADVSHYVRPRTALDAEARLRGTSCYFPRSVTPMLPEKLSNDLCSLRPNEDRPVMVARMTFSAQGHPGPAVFYPGLMRSRARLTYETVQALFDEKPADGSETAPTDSASPAMPSALPPALLPALLPEIPPMLAEAAVLARQLMDSRTRRGGLDFDVPEAFFLFDDDGRVTGVRARERLFSHRLIEAFMLAANEAVAAFLTQKRLPFPLRLHPSPDPDRLASLFRMLGAAGLLVPKKPDPAYLPTLLAETRESPQAPLVGRLLLRSMMQARYAPGPMESGESLHFGLASAVYCHFTSPIRRYPDLMVHRALKVALDVPNHAPAAAGQKLLALCDQCNLTERAAQEAEREINRRMGCLALESRIGEVLDGVIAGVNDFGLFVEPAGIPVEGLIRVNTLPDDWYEFDQDRQELVGHGRGLRFRLGQAVQVRLANVNVGRLEVDFLLADEGSAPGDGFLRRSRRPEGTPRTGGNPRTEGKQKPGGARRPHRAGGNKPADRSSGTGRQGRASGQGRSSGRRGR